MKTIKMIFWNSTEKRLRMTWRMLIQLAIFLPVLVILSTIVIGIGLGIVASQEGFSPMQLTDPAAAEQFVTSNPLLMLLNMLSTGVAFFLSVFIAGRFLDRRKFTDFGFHFSSSWWRDFGFGLGLGAVLMAGIFVIELAAGWITVTDFLVTSKPEARFLPQLLIPLLIFLAVGFYEELFSRGYQLKNLAEGLSGKLLGKRGGILMATLLSSAVFGFLHASNPNASAFSTINITIAGIFLAVGYLLTGDLAIPIGLHITWNFFQGNVFGFPVSGVDFRSATFIATQQGGPDLWTGGRFGPEAGLLGLLAMFVGILLTALWVKQREGSISLQLSLADPPAGRNSSREPEPNPSLTPEA